MFDSIIAFLQNQQWALLAAILVPFIFKFFPAFKSISNELCALLAALSAFATNVLAPTPAHAAIFGGALNIFAPVGAIFLGTIDALITKLIHDKILNPAYHALGLKAPMPGAPSAG